MHTLRHQRHNSTYVHTISEPCKCANSSSRCCVVVSPDSKPKVSLHILWMIKHACLKIRYATAMSYKSKALKKCPAFLTTPKSSLALGFREGWQRNHPPIVIIMSATWLEWRSNHRLTCVLCDMPTFAVTSAKFLLQTPDRHSCFIKMAASIRLGMRPSITCHFHTPAYHCITSHLAHQQLSPCPCVSALPNVHHWNPLPVGSPWMRHCVLLTQQQQWDDLQSIGKTMKDSTLVRCLICAKVCSLAFCQRQLGQKAFLPES